MRYFFILFLTLFISSCGFHPRGSVTLSPSLQQLYIKSADPYGWLPRSLANYLSYSGVHTTTSAENADTILEIQSVTKNEQLLSVSGTQQTRQYNLILSVTFQLTDPKGQILVASQTVSESRILTVASDQILGGSNEADNLYQQMHQPILYDIVTRLTSRNVTTALEQKKP